MKSEWRITSNIINDEKVYAAYRLLDKDTVDHSGNREYAGEYIKNRESVQIVVETLNELEASNG